VPADRAACAATFIVDRIAAVDGVDRAIQTTRFGTRLPGSTAEEVDRAVAGAAPRAAIVSRRVVGGEDAPIGDVEPGLGGEPRWTKGVVWIVTAIERAGDRASARTFLVDDESTIVTEMTAAGPVELRRPAPSGSQPPTTDATLLNDLLAHPITVGEALDHRDLALDDTELAIEGFAWTTNLTLDCAQSETGPRFFSGCAIPMTWLAPTDATTGPAGNLTPVGAGLNLTVQPETIGGLAAKPTKVIVLGHFDDHRAGLCPRGWLHPCDRQFVVDAIVSPENGTIDRTQSPQPDPPARPQATRETALGWLGLSATDPRLVVGYPVRTTELGDIEPAAVGAAPFHGLDTVWIARWIQSGTDGRPVLRTRIVGDPADPAGSPPRAYDVTASGLNSAPLPGDPAPTPRSTADLPPGAPTEVLGLPVIPLSEALARAPTAGVGDESDAEIAIGAYYVRQPGPIDCPPLAGTPGPIALTCAARDGWLTEVAQTPPIGVGGQFSARPQQPATQPAIRPEIPFDVPTGWFASRPEPLPVVVIGHFADRRSDAFDQFQRFVVDALVWRAGAATDAVVVIGSRPPTETADAVRARVADELGEAEAAWLAAVPTEDLAAIDPPAASSADELTRPDAVVWIVRRLVHDAVGRAVVRSAFTLDGSDRVWTDDDLFGVELANSIEVAAGSSDLGQVNVDIKDRDDVLAGARRPGPAEIEAATWLDRTERDDHSIQVANVVGQPGSVLVRWMGGACDRTWRLWVRRADTDGATIQMIPLGSGVSCRLVGITRTIVLDFRTPIDASTVLAVPLDAGG
jgi:hypothetical protein